MRNAALVLCCATFLVLSSAALGQVNGPVLVGDELLYPPDSITPRYLTDAERKYLETHELGGGQRLVTSPPTGPIHCMAEYEPCEGVLLNWRSFTPIIAQMAKEITTTGNAIAYIVVANASTQTSATNTLTANGTNMSRVKFMIASSDTVWIRDYGPRYIFEGDCRAIVDHQYNRPRPNDDVFPSFFSTYKHHAFYALGLGSTQLIHGGGNYHLDALGRSYCTRLVDNENPSFTETQIHDIWQNYQGVNTHFFDPFPTNIDSTQHLDMWMQVIADDKVIISDWPNNAGSTQDNICDNAAVYMASQGYTVYRVPAFSIGSPSAVHYTYTNVVMCNNLVLLPLYTNATVSPSNATALSTFQTALPGKTIVQVNCDAIIPSAGAMHCIAMHVPTPRGNGNPTVYLKSLRGPESLTPGNSVEIRWISDDDVSVSNVDILYSTNGGASYGTVIASATADDGSFFWTIPNTCTQQGRIRVVARDGNGNTGYDSSTGNLVILSGSYSVGDANCDCSVDLADVDAFTMALLDPSGYGLTYPGCSLGYSDLNNDGSSDGLDVALFVHMLVP